MALQQPKRVVQVCQRAQAEEVHLEEVHRLDVGLVPLDDGAVLHGGILYGDDGIYWLAAQEKTAGMNGQGLGKPVISPVISTICPRRCLGRSSRLPEHRVEVSVPVGKSFAQKSSDVSGIRKLCRLP